MTQKNSNPPPTFEKPAPPPNPPPAERSVSLAMYETMRRERDTARQALRDMHPGIVCEKCGASKRSDEMHSDICYGCAWIEQSSKLGTLSKAARAVLSVDYAEKCQECAIGQSEQWKALKALLPEAPT